MTLLELLIKKLPQCAGWPKDAARCIYHEHKEGATFYDVEGAMVKNGVGFIDLCIPDVRREEVTREQYEAALAASKQEWDGEGLPPVGCVCEVRVCEGFEKCEIVFSHPKSGVAYIYLDENEHGGKRPVDCISPIPAPSYFRPIRSEADKKRDIIISKIEKAYKDCPHSDAVPQAIYEAIAEHTRID